MKLIRKGLWIGLYLAGAAVLYVVLSPIIVYELESAKFDGFLSPVPAADYTLASNWFDGEEDFTQSEVTHYTLSIPKLSIKDAAVAIGGEDLSDSLIQYPSTALPGKTGNTVVFGHSILPQFYNPKDYLSIFSLLPTLKVGDEIGVRYDGISYTYRVEDLFEVRPEDIQVLDQNDDGSYMSLITCTPPGHPLKPKRLVVRAKIVVPT